MDKPKNLKPLSYANVAVFVMAADTLAQLGPATPKEKLEAALREYSLCRERLVDGW